MVFYEIICDFNCENVFKRFTERRAVFMSKQTVKQAIPKFKTEAQERAYWETHDSSDHVDWSKAKKVMLPNLRPSTKFRQ